MMNRRTFLCGLTLGTICPSLAADAQPVGKVPTIGVIYPTSTETAGHLFSAFEQGLAEQGYVPNKNVRIESRYTGGRADQLFDLATELVSSVDVLVVWSSAGAQAVQKATKTIPVVFLSVTAPEKIGLVQSIARPGGNITGVAFTSTETTYSKSIEILKEAVPTAARVAVLIGQANPVTMNATRAAAEALKITVEAHTAKEPEELGAALAAIGRSKVDGLFVPPSGLTFEYRKKIVEFAASRRLPAIYPFREAVEDGGLLSFGANLAQMARQGAVFVARILKGAKPADLPVEQPTKYDIFINLKTAKALGLTVPPSLLLRADQVIE